MTKEELISEWKEYTEAFDSHVEEIQSRGGDTSLKPSFEGFMEYLSKGFCTEF